MSVHVVQSGPECHGELRCITMCTPVENESPPVRPQGGKALMDVLHQVMNHSIPC